MSLRSRSYQMKRGKRAGAPLQRTRAWLERGRGFAPGGNPHALLDNRLVETWPIDRLKPAAGNPRTHSEDQIAQIAASIERFGFTNPVLVGIDGEIIAGHGRVAAARQLGWRAVPVLRLDQLSEAERRAYALADNRIAEAAGWDRDLLAIEFRYLAELDVEIDLRVTGFSTAEIDLALDPPKPEQRPDPADEVDCTESNSPTISQRGDLWRLGDHLLLCGDTLESSSFRQLMRSEAARLVFTDPPYNVAIAGNVTRSKRTLHREFKMASGEMTSEQFTEFLRRAATNLADASMDGALALYCMDWKHMQEMLAAGNAVYSEFKQLIVWNKDRGGLGSFYRSKHELIFVFKKGRAPHVNNFELGQHGRLRTNVWEYAGPRTNAAGANAGRDIHPTIKPVALVADAIKDTTHRGEIVLDGFAGSGTTIIAAEKTGRRARAIELDPIYVDACIRRWEAFRGGTATLSETGEAFSAVGVRRASISGPRVRRRPAVAE